LFEWLYTGSTTYRSGVMSLGKIEPYIRAHYGYGLGWGMGSIVVKTFLGLETKTETWTK